MNPRHFVSIFVAALALINLSGCATCKLCSQSAPPNILTAQEKHDGWNLLWDGKTTGGWRSAW